MLNQLYDKAPVFFQNILVSLRGFQIQKKRFNRNFIKYLEEYEKNNSSRVNENMLRHFLENAQKSTFWKKRFEAYGVNFQAENIIEEIKKLPILTKDEVKKNIATIANPLYKGKKYKAKTSGTTGGGLIFPYSLEMENKQWAVWWRYRRWHGIDLDMWCGWFGGRSIISIKNQSPPYWRINRPGKQVMFSAYHLNISTVESYYDEIKKRDLRWLHGYPSQLSLLAHLILERGLQPLLQVTHITFGSENLLDNQREIISRIFPNATLRQHYGLTEGVANISENINGELIADNDFCYVEFAPLSTDTPNLCKIVGTGFSNLAFPLIRYDTGDIAEIEHLENGGIKILSIDGRKEDFVTLPNGVKLGRLDHIFKDMIAIKEAQIHQRDLHHIDFNIVKGASFDIQSENNLRKEIRKRIDESVSIEINYVEKIPRTNSGKLRLVISDIKS